VRRNVLEERSPLTDLCLVGTFPAPFVAPVGQHVPRLGLAWIEHRAQVDQLAQEQLTWRQRHVGVLGQAELACGRGSETVQLVEGGSDCFHLVGDVCVSFFLSANMNSNENVLEKNNNLNTSVLHINTISNS